MRNGIDKTKRRARTVLNALWRGGVIFRSSDLVAYDSFITGDPAGTLRKLRELRADDMGNPSSMLAGFRAWSRIAA